jgi:hypothetical protein
VAVRWWRCAGGGALVAVPWSGQATTSSHFL